ncbi:efflux RND transporter periplasmic adaptor subunit [Aquimonas voraii]|uniref:HlyD family secretion protein n=1 Tax=Aquimonas voraii TaxID=265719 RepID=A0A1G6VMZ7_9GAMM|nr:efflux RND transporter periplasmic adaptor subunit [Aquimonas voraii]SDD54763.1 HlyD family secretion protein [Aquimonas voraii]
MIRDTAAQDRALAPATLPLWQRPALRRGALIALPLLLGLWGLSGWLSAERGVSAERLRIAEVSRGTLIRDAVVDGRVVAAVSPTLYAPSAGTVSLRTQAGAGVKAGDVLLEIDSPELKSELSREQASLASLEAEVGRQRIEAEKLRQLARRTLDEADIALNARRRDLARTERAHRMGALAEIEVLRAQDAVKSAEIVREHALRGVDLESRSVGFDLATREQAMQRQKLAVQELERRVDALRLLAPIDGQVGTVSVIDRAVVAANAPLVTVVDLSRLQAEIEVPETFADDVGLGLEVSVRLPQGEAPGRVIAISPEVVANRVRVRVDFEGGQPAGLRQNQRLSARLMFESKPDAVIVQRGPFVEAQGGRHAWVMDGDIAVRRPIRLGAQSVGAVEILEGVAPGERIVIAGTELFEDAERVAVR